MNLPGISSRAAAPLLLSAALALLLATPSAFAASPAAPPCAGCGKAIEGPMLQVGEMSFHPACFRCTLCGQPIEGEFAQKGEGRERAYYHPACWERMLPRCVVCGRAISDYHIEADGKVYHSECYDRELAPRCDRCGEVIRGEYFTEEGRKYCGRCYRGEVADRCVVCGEPITAGRYAVNHWKEPWHPECAASLRPCDVCGRALGGRRGLPGQPLGDGREICPTCALEAITDAAEARNLLEGVAQAMRELGVRVKTERVDFVLCGKDELERISGRWKTAGHTLIQARTLGGRTVGEKITVYILSHLGRTRFESVAAHELTHVYLHQQVKRELSSPIVEGLCNYMGSLLLERSPTDLARYYLATMEEDPDPDYGEGYRRIRSYLQTHTLEELLRKLKGGGATVGL